ncbi:hypothetical protein DL765_006352 [Monosporascus sp. GIB2]|nr:hypothetical protein DL765_006352 [Monosporascus sp. GIB2]
MVINQEGRTNDADKEISDDFDHLPMSLPDMSTDMNLGLDPSSLQAEIHPALAARYAPAGAELRGRSRRASQRSYLEASSRQRTAEQAVQTRWNDVLSKDNSDDLYDFSAPPMMLSSFHTTYPRHRISLGRNMSPQYTHQQGQDEMMMNFDQAGGSSKSFDGKDPGTDSGYGNDLSLSDLLQSPERDAQDSGSELQGHHQDLEEPANPNSDMHHSNMASWIRKLSDTNVQLHQHMHSIPVVETGQRAPGSSSGNSMSSIEGDARLSIDRTFKLSAQYTELLTSICARLRSRRSCNDAQTLANLTLDQPSQLLVLSCYMCLLESYDKILQHIKAWIEVRLKMGVAGSATTLVDDESSLCFKIKLPSLAIGSFELPKTSPIRPIVLTCVVETNMMHMHSLISEIMRPASNDVSGSTPKTVDLGPRTAEKRSIHGVADACDGLSSVAKVTLQAIEVNEDSTLKLVHIVSKLALRCVML